MREDGKRFKINRNYPSIFEYCDLVASTWAHKLPSNVFVCICAVARLERVLLGVCACYRKSRKSNPPDDGKAFPHTSIGAHTHTLTSRKCHGCYMMLLSLSSLAWMYTLDVCGEFAKHKRFAIVVREISCFLYSQTAIRCAKSYTCEFWFRITWKMAFGFYFGLIFLITTIWPTHS